MHPGHHIAEVHQLQQVASLPWLAHVANRAVLAIVLPRALQIIEGFPAAQPFSALIKLQQQLAAFTTQLQFHRAVGQQHGDLLAVLIQQATAHRQADGDLLPAPVGLAAEAGA